MAFAYFDRAIDQRLKRKCRSRRFVPPGAAREAFAKELRKQRVFAGMTRPQLAAEVAVSTRQIAYYEDGDSIPRPGIQNLLAFALVTTVEKLWRIDGR